MLSPYEVARLKNIEENRRVLHGLSLKRLKQSRGGGGSGGSGGGKKAAKPRKKRKLQNKQKPETKRLRSTRKRSTANYSRRKTETKLSTEKNYKYGLPQKEEDLFDEVEVHAFHVMREWKRARGRELLA